MRTNLHQLATALREIVRAGRDMDCVGGRGGWAVWTGAYLGEKVVRENEYLSAMTSWPRRNQLYEMRSWKWDREGDAAVLIVGRMRLSLSSLSVGASSS